MLESSCRFKAAAILFVRYESIRAGMLGSKPFIHDGLMAGLAGDGLRCGLDGIKATFIIDDSVWCGFRASQQIHGGYDGGKEGNHKGSQTGSSHDWHPAKYYQLFNSEFAGEASVQNLRHCCHFDILSWVVTEALHPF
jgi:hypothetical protein